MRVLSLMMIIFVAQVWSEENAHAMQRSESQGYSYIESKVKPKLNEVEAKLKSSENQDMVSVYAAVLSVFRESIDKLPESDPRKAGYKDEYQTYVRKFLDATVKPRLESLWTQIVELNDYDDAKSAVVFDAYEAVLSAFKGVVETLSKDDPQRKDYEEYFGKYKEIFYNMILEVSMQNLYVTNKVKINNPKRYYSNEYQRTHFDDYFDKFKLNNAG